MTGDLTSRALAIVPDAHSIALPPCIPQGWATEVFAGEADEASWEDLDIAEERIRQWEAVLAGMQRDALELKKAWRIIEIRRGILLDPEVTAGQRTDLSAYGKVHDLPPATASRYRRYARYADLLFPHIQAASEPHQVSQAALDRLIEESRKNEIVVEAPSAAEDSPRTAPEPVIPSGDPAEIAEHGADDEPELATELVRALEENQRLQETIDTLSASDLGAEVRKWTNRYARLEGRLRAETGALNAAKDQLKRQTRLFDRIRKVFGIGRDEDLVAAAEELVRASRRPEMQPEPILRVGQ